MSPNAGVSATGLAWARGAVGDSLVFQATQSIDAIPDLAAQLGKYQAAYRSLSQEKHTELFFTGLLTLTQNLKNDGQAQVAAEILFRALSASQKDGQALPAEMISAIATALKDLRGEGNFGSRFEDFTSEVLAQAKDPSFALPFFAGSLAGNLVKASWLGRGSALIRGMTPAGARLSASMLAFATEVPVFAASQRWLQGANHSSWKQSLLQAALLIGGLRLADGLHAAVVPVLGKSTALQGLSLQGTRFTALFGGQWAEDKLGHHPGRTDEQRLSDSLFAFLGSQVGGLWARAFSPMSRLGQEAQLRARHQTPRFTQFAWETVGVGRLAALPKQTTPTMNLMMMSAHQPSLSPGFGRLVRAARDHHLPSVRKLAKNISELQLQTSYDKRLVSHVGKLLELSSLGHAEATRLLQTMEISPFLEVVKKVREKAELDAIIPPNIKYPYYWDCPIRFLPALAALGNVAAQAALQSAEFAEAAFTSDDLILLETHGNARAIQLLDEWEVTTPRIAEFRKEAREKSKSPPSLEGYKNQLARAEQGDRNALQYLREDAAKQGDANRFLMGTRFGNLALLRRQAKTDLVAASILLQAAKQGNQDASGMLAALDIRANVSQFLGGIAWDFAKAGNPHAWESIANADFGKWRFRELISQAHAGEPLARWYLRRAPLTSFTDNLDKIDFLTLNQAIKWAHVDNRIQQLLAQVDPQIFLKHSIDRELNLFHLAELGNSQAFRELVQALRNQAKPELSYLYRLAAQGHSGAQKQLRREISLGVPASKLFKSNASVELGSLTLAGYIGEPKALAHLQALAEDRTFVGAPIAMEILLALTSKNIPGALAALRQAAQANPLDFFQWQYHVSTPNRHIQSLQESVEKVWLQERQEIAAWVRKAKDDAPSAISELKRMALSGKTQATSQLHRMAKDPAFQEHAIVILDIIYQITRAQAHSGLMTSNALYNVNLLLSNISKEFPKTDRGQYAEVLQKRLRRLKPSA